MGALSKRKGAAFERLVAKLFRVVWPEARRGHGQGAGGHISADVINCGPWWVQTKHGKSVNVHAAYQQAIEDQKSVKHPMAALDTLVVSRVDNGPILVTMQLGNFMDMVQGWYAK